MGVIDTLKSGIASVGYGLGLPGMGITEPMGTPYNVNQTPYSVFNATSAYSQPIGPTYNPSTAPQGYQALSSYGVPAPQNTQGPTAPPSGANQQKGAVLGLSDTNTGDQNSGDNDLNAQLDAIFSPQLQTLGEQEGAVGQQYGNTVSGITDQSALSSATLTQQKNENMSSLVGEEKKAGTRKEDALTSATRLYNELQRGGQQRFGGASSAGEAYQSLTAVEQQRKQGAIQTAYETAMQGVASLKSNLQQKFLLATKELEVEKNRALADAKMSFDEGIRQVQAARNQLSSDRATASLNMLQDLRNKVYAINLQSLQFSQQLALNNTNSTQKVDQATQAFLQTLGMGQQTTTNLGTQAMNLAGQTAYGQGQGQIASPNVLAQTGIKTTAKTYDPNDPSTWG